MKTSFAIVYICGGFLHIQSHNYVIGFAKPATYLHNGKNVLSLIDSSISKLINYHNTTTKSLLVYFVRGLLLRAAEVDNKCSGVHWLPLVVFMM